MLSVLANAKSVARQIVDALPTTNGVAKSNKLSLFKKVKKINNNKIVPLEEVRALASCAKLDVLNQATKEDLERTIYTTIKGAYEKLFGMTISTYSLERTNLLEQLNAIGEQDANFIAVIDAKKSIDMFFTLLNAIEKEDVIQINFDKNPDPERLLEFHVPEVVDYICAMHHVFLADGSTFKREYMASNLNLKRIFFFLFVSVWARQIAAAFFPALMQSHNACASSSGIGWMPSRCNTAPSPMPKYKSNCSANFRLSSIISTHG